MKKYLMVVPLLALGATLMLLPVHADDNGALVISDFGCRVIGGNTVDSHAVVTSNGNGVLSCHADVAPTASGHAEHYDFESTGKLCFKDSGILTGGAKGPAQRTEDWKQTTSASGQAVLTCKFAPLPI